MKLSLNGARLIEEFEGFVAHPYLDSVHVWTIGYGSTSGVGPNTPHVTKRQAEARMMREVNAVYGAAVNALRLPLTQNQFDALVSFVYNCGTGAISRDTTIGKLLRAHKWDRAADALLAWSKAGGQTLEGLLRRRHKERSLFLKADALASYTASEIRWIREYDSLKRANKDAQRRRVLQRYMTAQRKRIWHTADNDPRGFKHGMSVANRQHRYNSLLARTD